MQRAQTRSCAGGDVEWTGARVGGPVSLRGWLNDLFGTDTPGARPAGRVSGPPRSTNGASSFHLGWTLPGPCTAVSVVLEVLEQPVVPRLYFWALQADVAGPAGRAGGAHLGLQWHPGHPGATAVNWGGYHSSGGELDGSASRLPSATANPNTRDFAWQAGNRYLLSIELVDPVEHGAPGPVHGSASWRGSVRDLDTGVRTVVRDLYMPGDRIVSATMWSEVFARCDDPTVAVRWSRPTAHGAGADMAVERVRVNYQTHQDGGCANTCSAPDAVGLVQRTNSERSTPQGTSLTVP